LFFARGSEAQRPAPVEIWIALKLTQQFWSEGRHERRLASGWLRAERRQRQDRERDAGKTFSPANYHAMRRIKCRTPVGMDRPASDPAGWPGSMADKVASDRPFVTVHLT
jgi:hypothetical protein